MKETKNLSEITLKRKPTTFARQFISNSDHAAECIRQFYGDDLTLFESFFLLLIDRSNTTTGYVKISQGGIAGTYVDPKLIAKYAIESLASGIIIAHNHPSGNNKPSEADKSITKKIQDICKIIDVNLLDHVILTENSHFSFADQGLL